MCLLNVPFSDLISHYDRCGKLVYSRNISIPPCCRDINSASLTVAARIYTDCLHLFHFSLKRSAA